MDFGDAFQAHAGAGMEKVTSKDILVPRLGILQQLSPQLKSNKSQYIEDAAVGDICDLGTGELMVRPLLVLPVYYDKVWIEWAPRASGKGIIEVHKDDSILLKCKPNDKGVPMLNGNTVIETAQFYLLNLSASRRPSFIPFTSTQLKKARRWITLAQSERLPGRDGQEFMPPLFYRTYVLDTAMESNSQGDWAGWTVQRGKPLPEIENGKNILAQALAFRESISKGTIKADTASMADDHAGQTIEGDAEGAM